MTSRGRKKANLSPEMGKILIRIKPTLRVFVCVLFVRRVADITVACLLFFIRNFHADDNFDHLGSLLPRLHYAACRADKSAVAEPSFERKGTDKTGLLLRANRQTLISYDEHQSFEHNRGNRETELDNDKEIRLMAELLDYPWLRFKNFGPHRVT